MTEFQARGPSEVGRKARPEFIRGITAYTAIRQLPLGRNAVDQSADGSDAGTLFVVCHDPAFPDAHASAGTQRRRALRSRLRKAFERHAAGQTISGFDAGTFIQSVP